MRFSVHQNSMEPMFRVGDRILGHPLKYLGQIKRGDIVIFREPVSSPFKFKRVVGLPEEKLQITNGRIFVNNGALLRISELKSDSSNFGPVMIPQNHFFLLGDNMRESQDSRDFGTVPFERIFYKALAVYWPIKQIKILI